MMDYRIDPGIRMGPVRLIVRNMRRSLGLYRDLLGLKAEFLPGGVVTLRAGDEPLVVLTERQDAPAHPPRSTGLYHFAILVPSRRDLAQALKGLVQAGHPVQGASDHGVSEALYLADPEGNGIEIYRDRDQSEWPMQGDTLAMVTDPLDVRGLLSLAPGNDAQWEGLPEGTRIGHVHLHVSRIPAAEAFYTGALGFDLMQEYGPSAAFLSAGGYHHHIGVNTWAGVGAPPPPRGAAGLEALTIVYPTEDALNRAAEHLSESATTAERREDGLVVSDPSRNAILLTTR